MKTLRTFAVIACVVLVGALAVAFGSQRPAWAHCQIPCGIYDDPVRFSLLREHIATIEKSMNEINVLSKDPSGNANQLARWVMNKEDHAGYFADIVVQYFLQQRIKPVATQSGEEWDVYVRKITLCHEMLVGVMKAKQTTDLEYVEQLRGLVDGFEKAYLGAEAEGAQSHSHEGGHAHTH